MLDTNWLKLYEAALLEINPDKLAICIGAAEQAIAQRESLVDIREPERRQIGGRPFNAQEFEQNCFVARETGRT
jgi:hypothetical protein